METHFYLGANSSSGFYSLFEKFTDAEKDVLYIIKGNPGGGKSGFMKRVAKGAEALGFDVEYDHCSGDPDSLDGIYIPQLKLAYTDGTAPHVLEPVYHGVSGRYINLGQFLDGDAVAPYKNDIVRLTKSYKKCYAEAYKMLQGAASVLRETTPSSETLLKIGKRIKSTASKEFKKLPGREGKETLRFLGSITHKGEIVRFDTAAALAEKVYVLDNDSGFAFTAIKALADAAKNSGYDIIRCPDWLDPSKTAHLIVPGLSLAFVSQTREQKYPFEYYRHIRLDAFGDSVPTSAQKTAKKLHSALKNEAVSALASAKKYHDELEKVYNPFMDFDGIYALADTHVENLKKLPC